MTSRRQMLVAFGQHIANCEAVRLFCVEHFGRGLAVHVGAYPNAIPDESLSPFLWLTADGNAESESLSADDTFTVRGVVGGCLHSDDGSQVLTRTVAERTATANGLTVDGGAEIIEELRELIVAEARVAKVGAFCTSIRREENDLAHFPLEWAVFYLTYEDPNSLT